MYVELYQILYSCLYVIISALEGTDHFDITEYLTDLDDAHIYHLGIVLGLTVLNLKAMQRTPVSFLDDVISAWLRQENAVAQRGPPTWRTLAKALRHKRLGQEGIAAKITQDKGL